MTWSFDSVKYRVFNQNPLVSTDIEIRFHPIFKIRQEADIALFQDAVRHLFPQYKQNNIRGVSFDPQGNFGVQDEVEHCFYDITGKNSIILNQNSLRVSSTNHQNRATLLEQFNLGVNSLKSVFGIVSPIRLGVRYVNIIEKEKIISDLNLEALKWKDLVSDEFLCMPKEIASLPNTKFLTEIRSNLESSEGELVLRYGLVQPIENNPYHFRFDLDRYINIKNELELDDICEMIDGFTGDIYSLFGTVIGKELKNWMERDLKGDKA